MLRKVLFLVTAVTLLGAVASQAQTLDPQFVNGRSRGRRTGPRRAVIAGTDPNVFICNGCTSAPTAPTIFTSSGTVTLTFGVAGNYSATGGYELVILGVPGGPLATAPTVGGATLLNGSTGTTFSGTGTAYGALGLADGTGSQTITNWSATLIDGGPANPDAGVTSYTLYEYELPTGTSGVNATQTFTVSGAPFGTWVIGFACDNGTPATTGASCSGNDLGTSPFTTSGQLDAVPEPGTLALLGTGMLGLASLFRRRNKQAAR